LKSDLRVDTSLGQPAHLVPSKTIERERRNVCSGVTNDNEWKLKPAGPELAVWKAIEVLKAAVFRRMNLIPWLVFQNRGELMLRCVMAAVLGVLVIVVTPSRTQAGVYEHIRICGLSVRNTIVCIVLERGAEIAVEVTLKALYDFLFPDTGKPGKIEGNENVPEKGDKDSISRIKSSGVPWDDLKRFFNLNSKEFKQPVNEAQVRKILAASCATKLTNLCALVDVGRSTGTPLTCSTSATKSECNTKITCKWTGTSCVSAGGTEDLLKNLKK
jgi:hypothetical protein